MKPTWSQPRRRRILCVSSRALTPAVAPAYGIVILNYPLSFNLLRWPSKLPINQAAFMHGRQSSVAGRANGDFRPTADRIAALQAKQRGLPERGHAGELPRMNESGDLFPLSLR